MTLRTCARGLLASTTTVMVLAGSAGIAHAEPDPNPPPLPPVINQWVQIPRTFVNPSNQGQPTDDSGEVGMVCENLLVACR
jgi:hypothetical protein